ncbi:MASE4 domain-containing protein [Nocardioides sp.]|uniref:sensor histidine kinase n=1 Tax=Nocardioides sp. TaxID=35761 RepID=UPI001A1C0D42|nr:MASE4 domain-containing protein [Nocardioides sp.]MBJ7356778.1 MASE4 domain-containing protein [Nocardioides sp.]
MPVLVLVGLPFAGTDGPVVPGFTVGWLTLVLACDLITVGLLIGMSRTGMGPRPLLLAMAFLWSGAFVVMLAFAVPGALTATPTFASDANSTAWIWALRHTGPPLLIAVALAAWPLGWEGRGRLTRRSTLLALAGSVAAGPGVLFVWLALEPGSLPTIVDPETGSYDSLGMGVVLAITTAAVLTALAGVLRRGTSNGIEVWGVVAAAAWLGDVAFTFMQEDRFTLAWYGARLLGIAASAVVLGVILRENAQVRRRLAADNHDLEAQINDLLEAQRLRDHVTAVVSHDMRAPIAGLQGYLEIVDDEQVDPVFVARIHQRCLVLVRRLSLLTEDLQTAAVAAHGDLEVLPELLDVESQLAESAAGFPGLDLRIDCQPGLVAWVDPLRLQQILSNLIRNAERHGAEPVSVRVRSEPDGMVVFRVSDAGPGVSETFIPRLFERYSQGPGSAPGGSGLGLSVTRDLVRAHGGTVRYDLTDPAFIVTLPAAPTEIRTPNGRVISPPRRLATGAGLRDTGRAG